jgi:hypothetical protein
VEHPLSGIKAYNLFKEKYTPEITSKTASDFIQNFREKSAENERNRKIAKKFWNKGTSYLLPYGEGNLLKDLFLNEEIKM